MSQELHLLVNVAVAVAVALVGGLLAHALRQPVIVGYLLAGVVIGPFTPGFTGDREQIASLAEVGVIFLMFALGIEFTLADLARVRNVALIGTSVQVLLTIGAGVGLGAMLGWPGTARHALRSGPGHSAADRAPTQTGRRRRHRSLRPGCDTGQSGRLRG